MSPKLGAAVEMAVNLAIAGMAVRSAWVEAGKPGGEEGLQNIRKHKRKRLSASRTQADAEAAALAAPSPALAAPSPALAVPPPAPATPAVDAGTTQKRTRVESKPYRLNSKQIDKQADEVHSNHRKFVEVLKAATVRRVQPRGDEGRVAHSGGGQRQQHSDQVQRFASRGSAVARGLANPPSR
eukprot:7388975-Prymnesium_polylepis.2